nr:hypothetical protein CFP56_05630 [Quercus suber]
MVVSNCWELGEALGPEQVSQLVHRLFELLGIPEAVPLSPDAVSKRTLSSSQRGPFSSISEHTRALHGRERIPSIRVVFINSYAPNPIPHFLDFSFPFHNSLSLSLSVLFCNSFPSNYRRKNHSTLSSSSSSSSRRDSRDFIDLHRNTAMNPE